MNAQKYNLTQQQKQIVNKEIRNQIADILQDYKKDVIALFLYSLWMYAGWGKRKLHHFYNEFDKLHDELMNHYKLDDSDDAWLYKQKLKMDLDIDLEEWIIEDERKENT